MTAATRIIFNQTIANGKVIKFEEKTKKKLKLLIFQTWDCSLETKAQAVIKECLADNGGATDGTLKLSFSVTDNSTPEAIISQYKNALGLASSNLNSKSDVSSSTNVPDFK